MFFRLCNERLAASVLSAKADTTCIIVVLEMGMLAAKQSSYFLLYRQIWPAASFKPDRESIYLILKDGKKLFLYKLLNVFYYVILNCPTLPTLIIHNID